MRAVVLTKHGGPDVLKVEERPVPSCSPGHLLVDVRAAGVNFSDLLYRMGLHPAKPKLPTVLGYEVAGTVTAVGEETEGFAVGDRVAGFLRRGGYAERASIAAEDSLLLPDKLSFEQGAAIPLNYAAAYAALDLYGNCQPAERVLIHGAGGGVGSAATKMAKRMGLEVWGTASPAKHPALIKMGVDHPIDYTATGWEKGLPPMDLVMDPLGGASYRRSYDQLGAGGRLICFGFSGVVSGERRNLLAAAKTMLRTPRFSAVKLVNDSKAVIGLDTIAIWERQGNLSSLIKPLQEMVALADMEPVIGKAVPFTQASDAHRELALRRNVGKVVLVP